MRVLITGATGFTGGHLARTMMARDFMVRAMVRPGSDCSQLVDAGVELFEGQLTSKADVFAAAHNCDQIYHIAAVFRTAGHPDSYYRDVNVGGTQNVLDAARNYDCERLVYCSTGGVHGHIEKPPADENYRFAPDDIYQQTKVEAEKLVSQAMKHGQPAVVFRPGAIYGEGDLRFLKLFRSIQQRRFVMVGTGETRLHMVHIDDLVDGILRCGSRAEALGESFLLAGPEAPTLNEIARTVAEVVDVQAPKLRVPVWPLYLAGWLCEIACVPFRIDPPLHRRRVGFFTHHREFNINKARERLGFQPQVGVREGIERAIRWYMDQGLMKPTP